LNFAFEKQRETEAKQKNKRTLRGDSEVKAGTAHYSDAFGEIKAAYVATEERKTKMTTRDLTSQIAAPDSACIQICFGVQYRHRFLSICVIKHSTLPEDMQ
jgi:hypothetical protein